MMEIAFGESMAGSLKLAASMKKGKEYQEAVAIFGDITKEDLAEMQKPQVWTGETLSASPQDVYPMSLMLNMGKLTENRNDVLRRLYGRYDGVADEMIGQNEKALAKLKTACEAGERVRLWLMEDDAAEWCALYALCAEYFIHTLPEIVILPRSQFCVGQMIRYRGSGDVPAEELGQYAKNNRILTKDERDGYAFLWNELKNEDAPLRVYLNGKVQSVDEAFYDEFLREDMPNGEFVMARLIGKTLGRLNDVSDAWLYLRLTEMINLKELVCVRAANAENPYSAILKKAKTATTD